MGLSALASLSLLVILAGCAPSSSASPEASAPITTVEVPATAPPAAPSTPAATRAERPDVEAVLRCRQQRCANLGKACFDNCRRHGHPRDPVGHTRCNESCRVSYGVEKCEDECERSAAQTAR